MSHRTRRKTGTRSNVIRPGFARQPVLYVLAASVLPICLVGGSLVSAPTDKIPLRPPEEVAINAYACHLLGEIEKSLSFSHDWPGKDKYTEASKKWREHQENLEYRFGPIEIRENETLENAGRVVLPTLSMSFRNLSTGEVMTLPRPGIPKIAETVLEKRETPGGPRWYIISEGPGCAELDASGWLKLPRKKVSGSPTIVLRKAVVVQIVFEGKVVSERVIFADPNSR
ncbi:MAG: hypothetical protein FJ280_17920 [Planctomycetes bacterium]|nr:hypothetical protein [Planctomycetota bacterium]